MKKTLLPGLFWGLFLLVIALILPSCKSDFEKFRTSGDIDLMYKQAMAYNEKGEFTKAQALFELIMPSYRGKKELERISFTYAYTHYNLHNYTSANYYFKNFSSAFSTSPLREEADYMAAYSNYRLSPSFRLDQDNTIKAIDGFQLFINQYPESPRVKECNRLIDALRKKLEIKGYEEGALYYKIRQYQAAMQVFENLLKDYPETADVERIRFMILKSQFALAENSIFEKQLERHKLVLERYNDFVFKFPKSKYRKDAEFYLKESNQRIKELSNVRYQNPGSRT